MLIMNSRLYWPGMWMLIRLFSMREADQVLECLKGNMQIGRHVGDRGKVVDKWRHFELFECVLGLLCTLIHKVQCHMKCESGQSNDEALKILLNEASVVVCIKSKFVYIFCR